MTTKVSPPPGGATARPVSPLRVNRDFRAIFIGDAASQIGSQITTFVLPLLAVTTLGASGVQTGLLQAAYMAPFFVLPLAVGVWLDRRTKRPVMIAMDLLRFALVLWIPISALLGTLTMTEVYVVAIVGGTMTVTYDIAATSYVPVLLPSAQLAGGNSALAVNQAIGGTAGPGVAGWLSGLFGPAATLVFDALSYLTSASALLLVRHREVRPVAEGPRSLRRELAEGLRSVLRQPAIRAIAVHAGVYNAGAALMNVAYLIYFVRDLHHSPAQFGVVMVAGGVGAIAGAVLAPGAMRRLGAGPAFGLVVVFSTTVYLLLPLSRGGTGDVLLGAVVFGCGTAGASAGSVIAVTIRQRLTDPTVFARMNATYRLISFGLLAVGATTSGIITDTAGARTALWLAPIVLIASALPIYTRPVRGIRQLESHGSE